MTTRRARSPLALTAVLAALAGCPPPADFVTCEEVDACGTSGSTSTSDGETPTTSGSVQTVTGNDDASSNSSTTTPDAETGADTTGTTGEPAEPPLIIDGVVIPDYIDDNGILSVEASTTNAEGVHLLLDNGEQIELALVRPGEFAGQIPAFTALDNGKHTAVLTPWRDQLVGESVEVDYVIALPPPGSESGWQIDGPGGRVAAIAVLPDGRPVELGTYQAMGVPRCYLHLRDKHGKSVEFVDVLPPAYCRAIDLKIDRDSGWMHVLVEREMGDDTVWWAGEIPAWGKGPKSIGIGAVDDTAYALAARPDVVAVCGSRAVPTVDKLDVLAVLLRPGEMPEPRLFDYQAPINPTPHKFAETARDCAFAGDTLVLVGEANGKHDMGFALKRDRLMVIESDVAAADEPVWTVAGIELGVQTRAFALDLDEQGRYHLVGDKCNDACEPDGELWTYESGGKLVDHASIGPLGSSWFGPHDIAWSPAGYAVVAFGEIQGQSLVFKVQAFAPGNPLPLWTFLPNNKPGLQLALAAAVGPSGEVYGGGIAVDDQPAFKRIGG